MSLQASDFVLILTAESFKAGYDLMWLVYNNA